MLNYSLQHTTPLILQSEIAECGLASMSMVACYHGHQLDMQAMRKRFSANLKGMNLQQLIDLGDSLGLPVVLYNAQLMKYISWQRLVFYIGI